MENAFDRMQSEAMAERLKEQDEKVAKVQSLFPIQELFSFGPMANLTTAFTTGTNVARTELENLLGTAFAPLVRDINAFTGSVRNLFEGYYYKNRLGGAIGEGIGQAAGFIVSFYLPGGPLLWSQLFGVAGSFLGTFVQDFIESDAYDHPDVPGYPSSTTAGGNVMQPHERNIVNAALKEASFTFGGLIPPGVRRLEERLLAHYQHGVQV